MKNLTSKLSIILLMGLVAVSAQSCKRAPADNSTSLEVALDENNKSSDVIAYYFYGSTRCVTCMAIETVSKEAIKEFYGDKVTFESINREDEKDNPLVKKYKISGQALIIVKGDKMVDLTNDAFLNARTNPDKLKNKLKSTIDEMM